MTRLGYRGAPPKPRWWQGWAPAAFLLLLVGCLVYATGSAKQAKADLVRLRGQLAIQIAVAEHRTNERNRLQDDVDRLLGVTPTERIVVEPCVAPSQAQKHDVPVFSRDSQFRGTDR